MPNLNFAEALFLLQAQNIRITRQRQGIRSHRLCSCIRFSISRIITGKTSPIRTGSEDSYVDLI